ncbi:hypothetical protein Bbelb_160680 [Branchiostoma belcheri]|nr:hypothetical protein Bbelb_160680 [Branchiostoma belcheri]
MAAVGSCLQWLFVGSLPGEQVSPHQTDVSGTARIQASGVLSNGTTVHVLQFQPSAKHRTFLSAGDWACPCLVEKRRRGRLSLTLKKVIEEDIGLGGVELSSVMRDRNLWRQYMVSPEG